MSGVFSACYCLSIFHCIVLSVSDSQEEHKMGYYIVSCVTLLLNTQALYVLYAKPSKVKKKARVRNRYNQEPHLIQDTIW